MSRFIHQLSGLLLVLALVFGCVAVASFALRSAESWSAFAGLLARERLAVAGGAVAMCCLAVLYLLSGIARPGPDTYLTFQQEGGTTRLSLRGLTKYVSRLAADCEPVVGLKATIAPGRTWVDVVLDIRVKDGVQVQEVCASLQQRVRERLRDQLGVAAVRNVQVNVREIL